MTTRNVRPGYAFRGRRPGRKTRATFLVEAVEGDVLHYREIWRSSLSGRYQLGLLVKDRIADVAIDEVLKAPSPIDPRLPTRPRRVGDRFASPARLEGGFLLPSRGMLTGQERFVDTDATVLDFWRWGFSDLGMSTIRSAVAEFLVARALGDTRPRATWLDYDVLTPGGLRVEVKAAGYLQRWRQWKLSAIQFSGFTGRSWDPDTGYLAEHRTIRADVFVFAVQEETDPETYDPLAVGQWRFYVVPATAVEASGYRSATLGWVRRQAGDGVRYAELPEAVARAAEPPGQSTP